MRESSRMSEKKIGPKEKENNERSFEFEWYLFFERFVHSDDFITRV